MALKLGYNHTNILDKIELFELSDPIILYAQDAEFDDYENFDKNEINFAFKQEIIIINAKFCLIAKKDSKVCVQVFYKKQFNKINHTQFLRKLKNLSLI
ncbi:hypothetical protein [Campylobacter vulpis]|uniref:hypothetical protein n=1 Tax=Campylobacter vulpis TaxID=1655500 RepID=UPI000C1537DD|nr:hypothetical protein [Campylobacter vulpis]MBS4275880.1 hypothetical protein [Campylobacter vulpis]MBS4307293.1 hypothetical protein [Campylobacter vulpis]MBS4330233.1 hypothetical protein [Campylobacter vulpis]MBS4423801.1 hypothetical protein [Campylobacter vulpis]PHY90892.1 hypothetical protein AA995_04950 [Campylobacter vulpis]